MKGILTDTQYLKRTSTPNVTVIGTGTEPSITDGILSGLTTSAYAILPKIFDPKKSTWEMQWEFTTGSDVSTSQYIYNEAYTLNVSIIGGDYTVSLGTGSSLDILATTHITPLSANTTYTVRDVFTGSQYLFYLNDTLVYTCNSSVSLPPVTGYIGATTSQKNPFLGSINLNNCYIKIDGKLFWTGVELEPSTEDDYNYIQEAGIPSIVAQPNVEYYKNFDYDYNCTFTGSMTKDCGKISGFSSNNYVTLPSVFKPSSKTWEIVLKIKTGVLNGSDSQILFSNNKTASTSYGIFFGIYTSNKFYLAISGNGSSWNISSSKYGSYVLQANTEYWVKMQFTGTQYILSYSTNGETYTADITVSSSTAIYGSAIVSNIGTYVSSSRAPFLGSIDLTESYIKVDGSIWWNGIKAGKAINTATATIVGSPINTNGVLSNFSSANYLQLDAPSNVFSFEVQLKITLPTTYTSGSNQYILSHLTTNYRTPIIIFTGNGNLNFDLSSNGVNWDVVISVTSSNLTLGETYIANFKWNGGLVTGTLKDSLGNIINFKKAGSYRNYAKAIYWSDNIKVGVNTSGNNPFTGSVDLNESYIILNNKLWWTGLETSSANQDNYDLAISTKKYKACNLPL